MSLIKKLLVVLSFITAFCFSTSTVHAADTGWFTPTFLGAYNTAGAVTSTDARTIDGIFNTFSGDHYLATVWSGALLVIVTTPLAALLTLIPVPAARLVFFQ